MIDQLPSQHTFGDRIFHMQRYIYNSHKLFASGILNTYNIVFAGRISHLLQGAPFSAALTLSVLLWRRGHHHATEDNEESTKFYVEFLHQKRLFVRFTSGDSDVGMTKKRKTHTATTAIRNADCKSQLYLSELKDNSKNNKYSLIVLLHKVYLYADIYLIYFNSDVYVKNQIQD